MLRFVAVLFTVLLTHADCRPIVSPSTKVNEFESGLEHLLEPNEMGRHDMIDPRKLATLHRDSTASKFTAGVFSGRALEQASGLGPAHGATAVGPSSAMQPPSHAPLGTQLHATYPEFFIAGQPATAPSNLLAQAGAATPQRGNGEFGPTMLSLTSPEVPESSPHGWPYPAMSPYASSPYANIGPEHASTPQQRGSIEGPDAHQPGGMSTSDLPSSSPASPDAAVGAPGNVTEASVPVLAPPPPPAPRPPPDVGTLLDSFASDPVSQGRLGLSVVVIVSTIMFCCSSAACVLFLLKRYKEAAREEMMPQWDVPQYARYLARNASSSKCKKPPPPPDPDTSLSASWPNQTPSRSVNFLPSSTAPSLCAARSAEGSCRGSGAWWEAIIAGGGSAEAAPPEASPGVGRSPVASRMISRMLSVLPEVTDELAQTQSLTKGGGGSMSATAARPAPHDHADGAKPGTNSGLPRASSSEMTTVRGPQPVEAAPVRYAASPLVNRHSGQAVAAPLPCAAHAAGAAGGTGSSAASREHSRSASASHAPAGGGGAADERGPATIVPCDPRLGKQRTGTAGASGLLPPAAADGQGGRRVPEQLSLQRFDSVFSEALPSHKSGQSAAASAAATGPPASNAPGGEARVHQRYGTGASGDLPRPPQRPSRHRAGGSNSNGSINFMYSMRDLSQTLVVNQEKHGPVKVSAKGAEAAEQGGARASTGSCAPCRQFLQGQPRLGTPDSSAVCGDSGTGQEEESGSTSMELSAVARNVAAEWRRNARGDAVDKEGGEQPSQRLLQRSSAVHRSTRHSSVACAKRAAAASRDPAWFGTRAAGRTSGRPAGPSQTATALRTAMSIATGEAASLVEAAAQAHAAELSRHASMPVARAARRHESCADVSEYALHWLSKTRLHGVPNAAAGLGTAQPATGWYAVEPRHAQTARRSGRPEPRAGALRTRSFGCQADADTIAAEVLDWRRSTHCLGVARARVERTPGGRPRPRTGAHTGRHSGQQRRSPGRRDGQAARGGAELQQGEPWELADVSDGSLVEQVPLLQGVSRSSGSGAGGSPVTDCLMHSSPTQRHSSRTGDDEPDDMSAGEQHGLGGPDVAPPGMAAGRTMQDRYGAPDGWVDSIETMANMPVSTTAAPVASGDACLASPAKVVVET